MTMAKSMKQKAVSGMVWTTIERLGSQIVFLLIGIAIARILTPDDFGIIGMTAIFMSIGATLIDSGFGSALIQNQDRTQSDYSTCFYFNIIVGCVLYLLLYLSAPLIAGFYDAPVLTRVIRALGLLIVLNSSIISQTAMLTVRYNFKALSIISISSQSLSGLIALFIALGGYGVWALVWQQLLGGVFRVLFTFGYTRWLPGAEFSAAAFRRLFSYGGKILCSSMINTVYENIYTLVIGKSFGARDVGLYTRASQFAQLPSQTLMSIVMKVSFPILAEVQNDTGRLSEAYDKFMAMTLFVLYPVLTGLIVLAKPFIVVVLGNQWADCVPFMQIICFVYIFEPLTTINLNLLYVKGRTDLVLKLELLKKPIAFLIVFSALPFGIIWLCVGRVVYNFIAFAFNCHYTARFIGLGFAHQMRFVLVTLIKAMLMGAAVWASTLFFDSYILQLTIGTVTGIAAYTLIALVTRDSSFGELCNLIRRQESSPSA